LLHFLGTNGVRAVVSIDSQGEDTDTSGLNSVVSESQQLWDVGSCGSISQELDNSAWLLWQLLGLQLVVSQSETVQSVSSTSRLGVLNLGDTLHESGTVTGKSTSEFSL